MVVNERERELLRLRQEAVQAVMLLFGVMNELGAKGLPQAQMTAAEGAESATLLVRQLTALAHPGASEQERNALMLAALPAQLKR